MTWPIVALNEAISLEYGKGLKAADRDVSGGYTVAGSNGQDGVRSEALVRGPGVVVGRKGPAGKVVWYEKDFWPIDTTYYVVPKVELSLRWVYYLLRNLSLEHLAVTTGVPGLNRNDAYVLKVPLPPPSEQRRVVETLDQANDLRELRAEADAKADRILPALFLKMFGEPATNPLGWPTEALGELGELDRGRSRHRSRNDPALPGGPYPLIQTGDVANCGGRIKAYTQTYSELGLAQSKMWPAGTLCITIAAHIANTGVLEFDACFPDSVVGFQPGPRTTTEYVQFLLGHLRHVLARNAPQVAQKNILAGSAQEDLAQALLSPAASGDRREGGGDVRRTVLLAAPRMVRDLINGISDAAAAVLGRFHYLGPPRSYPPRHLAFSPHHDPNWHAGGGAAWDVLRRDDEVRAAVNRWLSSADRLSTPYEVVVRDLLAFDQLDEPLRAAIEAIQENDGLGIEADYDDESEPTGAYPIIKDVDAEVENFKTVLHEADVDRFSEIVLMDRRSNTVVSHRDVGIGCPLPRPVVQNLKFLIGLRHEVEHQMTTRIDDLLSARFQACCINFHEAIVALFGEGYGIAKHLALSLQFSSLAHEQVETLEQHPGLPANVKRFIQGFDGQLDATDFGSAQFAYRVIFVPKTVNHPNQADQVIKFVKADSPIAQQVNSAYAVVRETEKPKWLPSQIVKKVKDEGFPRFGMHQHTQLWKVRDAKNPAKGYGVQVAKVWYWYESWLDEVRAHCRASGGAYR